MSWKTGFDLYRDAPVGAGGENLTLSQQATQQANCLDAGYAGNCRIRFDRNRKDIFHYGLYAHARGVPKSLFACLDGPVGQPTGFNSEGSCTTHNPLFHVPRSSAGVADVPGGDFIISLGFWDGFVGTDFVQASTTLHELGHNLERWHGGDPPQFSSVAPGVSSAPEDRVILFEPNCKPNYLSVMSYLFQVRGLLDDAGDPHLSYSSQVIDPLDETSLGSGVTMPGPYRTAWFAPRVPGTLGYSLGIPAAKRFCTGSNFPRPSADRRGLITLASTRRASQR